MKEAFSICLKRHVTGNEKQLKRLANVLRLVIKFKDE